MRNWKTQWWIQDLLGGQTFKVEAAQCQILDCPGDCLKMKNFGPKGMGTLPNSKYRGIFEGIYSIMT